MTDLIQRLREAAEMPKSLYMPDVALREAASALEAQQRRIGELLDLLRESRTHLMQGDCSEWRKRVEAALASKETT